MQININCLLRQHRDDGLFHSIAGVGQSQDQNVFVPGELPCGECGPCRRGYVSACRAPRLWLAEATPAGVLELPERYTYCFDAAVVSPAYALWAALIAPLLEALGRAGLGAGDVSFWVGNNPLTVLGACLAAGRGSKTVLVGTPSLEHALKDVSIDQESGQPVFLSLSQLNDAVLGQVTQSADGFAERNIFVMSDDSLVWSAAGQLLAPGATLVSWGGLPALAGLPADARILTLGLRYNPDFVPEALAALATNPALLKMCQLLLDSGAYESFASAALA